LYTVRIKEVTGKDCIPPKIRYRIYRLLKGKLSKHGLKFSGVWPFLGKDTYLSMSGFRKDNGDLLSSLDDWIVVHECINNTLDELKIIAHVRNETHTIRSVKRGEEGWS
jgi:hypothetical protein